MARQSTIVIWLFVATILPALTYLLIAGGMDALDLGTAMWIFLGLLVALALVGIVVQLATRKRRGREAP